MTKGVKVPPIRCPDCGLAPMVERMNKQNGSKFLGCRDYPSCGGTRPIPEFVAMIRAGHTPLPGLEP